jgi:hypothetical protein
MGSRLRFNASRRDQSHFPKRWHRGWTRRVQVSARPVLSFSHLFHEQADRLRIDAPLPDPEADVVRFSAYVQVEFTRWIENLTLLESLADLHILRPEVLEQRFAYDAPKGLHVAMIRAFRITPEWSLPFQKSFGGCRSWIELPESPANLRFTPVIEDAEHATRTERVLAAIDSVREP